LGGIGIDGGLSPTQQNHPVLFGIFKHPHPINKNLGDFMLNPEQDFIAEARYEEWLKNNSWVNDPNHEWDVIDERQYELAKYGPAQPLSGVLTDELPF